MKSANRNVGDSLRCLAEFIAQCVRIKRTLAMAALAILCLHSRDIWAQDYLTSIGTPSFTTPYPAEMGMVDAASGKLHMEIPFGSYPQRGRESMTWKLAYDSLFWAPQQVGNNWVWAPYNNSFNGYGAGWYYFEPTFWGGSVIAWPTNCTFDEPLSEPNGTQHWFHMSLGSGTIASGCSLSSAIAYATDSSGLELFASYSKPNLSLTLYSPHGSLLWLSPTASQNYANYTEDSNGNYTPVSGETVDTLGRSPVQLTGLPQSSCFYQPTYMPSGTGFYTCINALTSDGTYKSYTLSYADVLLKSNFGQSGITECTTNCWSSVITAINLPDKSTYSFLYDCDSTANKTACSSPGGQTAYYGMLTSMKLPSGQTISYSYANFTDVKGNVGRWLTSKFNGSLWQYAQANVSGSQQVTVYKPDYSKDVLTFTINNGAWPTSILSYDTDGATLLSTISNTWDFSQACTLQLCNGQGSQDVRKTQTRTTLPLPGSNITNQTTFLYDSPQTGNVMAVKEWKYQSGTSPTFSSVPDRAIYTTYATIGNHNNINRTLTETICNSTGTDSDCPGGGSKAAKIALTYDGYGKNNSLALQPITGTVNHDDTNFGVSYTARGNATQISHWVSGTTYLNTALSYDTTGQVVQSVDPAGNIASLSYVDNFYNDNGSDPPNAYAPATLTNAYLTKVTDPVGVTSRGYYFGSGKTAFATDYNAVATYSHYMDSFDRSTETDIAVPPNSTTYTSWGLNTYTSPTQVDSYSGLGDVAASTNCASCLHTQALLDGLSRLVTLNLVNNPAGTATINNSYDGINRVYSTTHPYIGTGDPNNVLEYAHYDGLGRSLGITHPDGQTVRSVYGAYVGSVGGLTSQQSAQATYGYGFPVASMDEAGKQRQEWIDGFGHVIEVDEPSTNTATYAKAIITVTGSEGSTEKCNPNTCICHTVYDSGYLTVTVNGFAATAYWGKNSTAASVAASLAGALNSPESPVTAIVNGTAITMIAGGPGAYSISFKQSFLYNDFQFTPTSGTLTGGSGGLISSPFVTTYTYDVLGNLTGVTQGSQSRTHNYDGLSRLTQETTPETGTVTLSYVNSSGTVCSGNPSNPCSRTDARSIKTTYTYDGGNRLVNKAHSDATGTVNYSYDTGSYGKGHLATMTDPSGSESYTYDQAGRVTRITKVIGTTAYATSYLFNGGGQLTQLTYPSGRVVQYSYDNVGHLCAVAGTTSSCSTVANPFLTIPSLQYDAAGRALSATYGNGIVATASYSPNTFGLASLSYARGTTTLLGLNYYYQQDSTNCPTGNSVGNNGQIQCIADVSAGTGDPGRSAAYTYDSIGRLLTAKASGSTQYPAWGLSWTYDRYGNRTAQTVTAGSGYNASFTINPVNNRITNPAFTYDTSGNVTAEPAPLSMVYTYDGEECNTGFTGSGNTATYTCDANHMRVKKVVTGTNAVTTIAIRSGGQAIAEYDNGAAVTSPTREYLYGNSLLATVVGSTGGSGGTIIYQHRDHLSPRLYTDLNGNDVGEQGTFPFGESWYNNNTTSSWVFTSYERDRESGNDYALARTYANGQGRFLAPDPLEGVVSDPQTLNRYAYVGNDPISRTDPRGASFWGEIGELFGVEDDDNQQSPPPPDITFGQPQVGYFPGDPTPIDISNGIWTGPIPAPGTNWTASYLAIGNFQWLQQIQLPVLADPAVESTVAELSQNIQNLTTLSSLAEVGVQGIQGAQLAVGIWNLPSLGRGVLSLIRGPGIQTLGLQGAAESANAVNALNVADDSAAYEQYWNNLGNRAPVQSSPYNIVNKYNVSTGELKSVTTYDAFGNRAYQYEFGGRWGAEYHFYDNSSSIPGAPGFGNGPRSHPGIPF